MVTSKEISKFLNETLNVKNFKEGSNNGLQVENTNEIKKIAFAVDAHLDTFEKAKKENCDMIIVHHGISFADSLKYITNQNYNRIKSLITNNIALYGCHLPLDAHNKYGNNIQLANILNLTNIKEFGEYDNYNVGFQGEFKEKIQINELIKIIEKKLNSKCPNILKFGKEQIKTIGIISGGGGSILPEAIEKELDCLLTGEFHHHIYNEAKEGKINLIAAGHYATETVGVKALMPLLKEKFNIECIFLDSPTEM